jgi:hypothetical protein
MYNPALKLVPLGSQAEEGGHVGNIETSIDSLHAAPFLFWAARTAGDVKMREVAHAHAARARYRKERLRRRQKGPMSLMGLGCVKTLHRKCRGVAILADCRVGAFFGFDYALIAAMSG